MANESVTESQAAKHRERCKHDLEMVNAVNERISKATAIIDLLMTVDSGQLFDGTVSGAGWAVLDLLDEVKGLVNAKQEAEA